MDDASAYITYNYGARYKHIRLTANSDNVFIKMYKKVPKIMSKIMTKIVPKMC